MLQRAAAILEDQSRDTITLVAIVALVAIGVLDYVTGTELAFSVFYFLPISIVAWLVGGRVNILIAVAASLTWLVAELQGGRAYSSTLIPLWNTLTRLGTFLIVAGLLSHLRAMWRLSDALAHTDALTGVANSRAFMPALQAEIDRARRYRRPLTLACIDIDNFKSINDQHGHHSGDSALRTIADTLRESTRASDIVARLGGDEFAILFPETDEQGANRILASLNVRTCAATRDLAGGVSLSVGAVTYLDAPPDADSLIRQVDAVMYLVKARGKASVAHEVFGPADGGASPSYVEFLA